MIFLNSIPLLVSIFIKYTPVFKVCKSTVSSTMFFGVKTFTPFILKTEIVFIPFSDFTVKKSFTGLG